MTYVLLQKGESRSFPNGDAFLKNAAKDGEILIHLGTPYKPNPSKTAVLIELHTDCLGFHTGESAGEEGSNALGFARWRNGIDPPSNLIEVVRQPATDERAIEATTAMFEAAGFSVVVCADLAGRIIDRLVRPKLNSALTFLDEGLTSAHDMDLTCRLGLGYVDGPIERLIRGGLVDHYDVTSALFEVYGTSAYAPSRRSLVAKQRSEAS